MRQDAAMRRDHSALYQINASLLFFISSWIVYYSQQSTKHTFAVEAFQRYIMQSAQT